MAYESRATSVAGGWVVVLLLSVLSSATVLLLLKSSMATMLGRADTERRRW
jgi:hypothetical protein